VINIFYFLICLTTFPSVLRAAEIEHSITDGECLNDQQCEEGEVCATVRGELPGSCALSMDVKPINPDRKEDCMKDRECDNGEVCATVRGELPGSCARKGNKLF
jgi:hypothetical protein